MTDEKASIGSRRLDFLPPPQFLILKQSVSSPSRSQSAMPVIQQHPSTEGTVPYSEVVPHQSMMPVIQQLHS
jgi:hypothetical protein